MARCLFLPFRVAQAKLIARSQRRAAHARTGVFWGKWLQRVGERMHARVTATLAQSGPWHVPGTRQSPLTVAPSQERERARVRRRIAAASARRSHRAAALPSPAQLLGPFGRGAASCYPIHCTQLMPTLHRPATVRPIDPTGREHRPLEPPLLCHPRAAFLPPSVRSTRRGRGIPRGASVAQSR